MKLDPLTCRSQFPGLKREVAGRPAIFFDGPAGSQVPASVIAAVADCLANHNANDGGLFATSREVGGLADSARATVADLLGCDDADTVVFGLNMTTLTFALSRSLAKTWRAGDEIIVTRLDHDANVLPGSWQPRMWKPRVQFIDVNPIDCTLRTRAVRRIPERTNAACRCGRGLECRRHDQSSGRHRGTGSAPPH